MKELSEALKLCELNSRIEGISILNKIVIEYEFNIYGMHETDRGIW